MKHNFTSNTARGVYLTTILVLLVGCAGAGAQRSTGEVIDDAVISTRVKSALLADATTDGLDIEVEVDRGVVQLHGFADSGAEIARASDIANGVAGVVSTQNNLRLTAGPRSTGEYIDDKILLARVNTELARDDVASAFVIDVEVNRGVVSLGGFVDSQTARNAATVAAMRAAGVREVANNLVVR